MRKILVLGDQENISTADEVCAKLTNLGYEAAAVDIAAKGYLTNLQGEKPDLLIIDIGAENHSQRMETIDEISTVFGVPVLYLVSAEDVYLVKEAGIEEPYEYVLKPAQERELHISIETTLCRRDHRKELEEIEERFRSTFEQAAVGISHTSIEGQFLRVNQRFCGITGYSEEEALRINFKDITHPDDLEVDLANTTSLLAGDIEGFSIEKRYLRKDGSIVWINLTVSLVQDVAGEPQYLIGVVEDISQRKKSEEALRESEEKYRQIFSRVSDAIMIFDAKSLCFLDANEAMLELYGYTRDELMHLSQPDITAEPEKSADSIEQTKQGEQFLIPIRYHRNKDGRVFPVEITGSRFNLEGREILCGVVRDMTGRIELQRSLEQRATQLSLLSGVSEEISAVLNLESVLERAVQLVQESFGYHHVAIFTLSEDQDKVVMRARAGDFAELFPSDHALKLGEGMVGWAALYGETGLANNIDAEPRYVNHYPGIIRTRSELCVPIQSGGRIAGVLDAQSRERDAFNENDVMLLETLADQIAVAMENAQLHASLQEELAERVQAEEERERLLVQVRAQAQQVREIMNTVPEGVILLDATGAIITANMVALSELSALADARIGDILTKVGDQTLYDLMKPPPVGLWHEVKSNGRTFEIITRPTSEGTETGQWVMVLRDVTREREVQHGIRQQERLAAVGQLAAGIAHDFNNILAVILLYTEMALGTPYLEPRLQERLLTIAQQSKRASELVQQVLDFSRRAVLERTPMDLLPFLQEQTKLLERTLPENIKINLSFKAGEHIVSADPIRMQQAIMNLAVNARDAMPDGGELNILLSKSKKRDQIQCVTCGQVLEGEWIGLTISDSGSGISPEIYPHIFEPFFTTKGPGEGTGLGLAQVYGIIKQHEGHIDVHSQINQGSKFTIHLPALKIQQPKGLSLDIDTLPRGQGQSILVVEDEPATKQALIDGLTLLGYRVSATQNGLQALGLIDQQPGEFDLVLSDVIMPEMGGIELFREIRKRELPLPVVLITGHPMVDEIEKLGEEGSVAWMTKPPRLRYLAEVVIKALEKS